MTQRRRITVEGAVQGVGFRPFVYRLARAAGLSGWVLNDSGGVTIEVEGNKACLEVFLQNFEQQVPPAAVLTRMVAIDIDAVGDEGFEIRHSAHGSKKTVLVQADLATCAECLLDIGQGRRQGYAFTNCTNCGPRFSILRALPYDRSQTTMASFEMCPTCQREYADPCDRRFHAQPNACPQCGPTLRLLDANGEAIVADDPIAAAAMNLGHGRILACKGLGGFHLMVDATNTKAVETLRERKHRPNKPFALMVGSLQMAGELAEVSPHAAAAMSAPSCPIMLLPRLPASVPRIPLASAVAPGLDTLGIMLPTTPLHHVLLAKVRVPLVATSGNLSEEPLCTSTAEALERLGAIADVFLTHDRSIVRPLDDSVAWIASAIHTHSGSHLQLIRRARGFAPLPLASRKVLPTVLAVGGQQKNSVALSVGTQILMSQHIGDLEHPKARQAFESTVVDLCDLYEAEPELLVCDLHPDYASTQWAESATAAGGRFAGVKRFGAQHHHAHLVSCLAEHDVEGPVLGLCWDGTGLGTDGTIWGGEALLGDAESFTRFATLQPFSLPGGSAAIREPRRIGLALAAAVGMADGVYADDVLDSRSKGDLLLLNMIRKDVNSPTTTSMGRLFDGIAALLGFIRGEQTFEAQAAMALECAARRGQASGVEIDLVPSLALIAAPENLLPNGPHSPGFVLDWRPFVADLISGKPDSEEAAFCFHLALANAAVAIARAAHAERVALTGGCFQNRLLLGTTVTALLAAGVQPLVHKMVPANDGGLAVGQLLIGAAASAKN